MTIEAVDARVREIGQMATAVTGRPRLAESATSFALQLQSATDGAGATTTTITPTTSATTAAGGQPPFGAEIDAAAARCGIDPALLKGLIRQESGFDPSARSSAGAVGLTQLMPATAAELGVDPTDPVQAIDGGARYLKQQLDRFGGDPSKALAAYNAGPGAVTRYGGVPPYPETQRYVQAVLAFAAQYRAGASTSTATTAVPTTTTPVPATGSTLGYATT